MSAEEILKTGDLTATLAALTDQVRNNPSDPAQRVFLFQLFCVLGKWKRAITQLKVCAEMDPQNIEMAQSYREAIVCELLREKVFAGEKSPMIFGEPSNWIALLTQSLSALQQGDVAGATTLRNQAFDGAPAPSGMADETPFAWIADADMRLGPVLELIMNGNYYWVPFDTIKSLKFEEPTDLRDRVWTPVQIKWVNGGEVVGFIPTRYPEPVSDAEKLAKVSNWIDLGGETFVGKGQRLFATDGGDLPLMDLREIIFDTDETDG